jgi:hypothetical protein
MNLLKSVIRFCLGLCSHEYTYRERRSLHGVQVMHLVCERCGQATPVMQRTAGEHRRIVKAGTPTGPKIHRDPAQVVSIGARREPDRSRQAKSA